MSRRIVVTSGKGGVGKTTIVGLLGYAIASMGYKILLVDMDFGLNNLDILMSVENKIVYDIIDVVEGRCSPKQALIQDFYENDERWGTQEERFKAPLDFIETLRERMIILEVAEEQKINPDEVKLTKEDNNRVSLKDACKLMDEDSDFFVSSDCPFSYILNYVGKYSNCGTYYNTRSKE